MNTQTPHVRKLLGSLAFALVCVVLSIFMFRAFDGTLPLEPKGYRIHIPLPNASNVYEGNDVQISGLRIGSVITVTPAKNGTADVLVEIDDEYAPISAGSQAVARLKTLLGEGYIELSPDRPEATRLREGGTLKPGNVQPSQRLDDFLGTFDSNTRTNLQRVFAGLARSLDGRAGDLNDAIGTSAPFSDSLDGLMRTLDGQRADIRTLLSNAATMYGALGENQGALQAAVRNANAMLEATARRERALASTVRALPPFLNQVRTTSDVISDSSPELNRAVTALLPVAPLVSPALAQTRTTMPQLRGLFKALPAVLRKGNRALPALSEMAKSEPAAFRQLYPLSRQLIPIAEVLKVNQRGIIGTIGNVGAAANGRMRTADGRVEAYFSGFPSVWNEIIGGWKKRLPTNRSNPYPRPDSALDIGKTGVLKTFDCRHLNNTLYLPPTGSGAPPCVEEGPWEFQGKKRYYPHLTPAPP